MEYKFNEIEKKWQDYWRENKVYRVSNNSGKPKYYVLDMFPYPSGAGLHVGHPLGYIASDIYSRYKRLKGFNVLHPMGFDSFGLPAEQYALETGQHPATTTEKNITTFKAQLDKIGFCYDWDRELRTSDPQYYKWTQWIFLQLYNSYFCNTQQKARPIADLVKKYETKGCKNFTADQWNAFTKKEQEDILMNRRLAFSAYGEVNWCEALGTVLANDEVVNGVSERGGHPVERKKMRQWFLRITAYANRLLQGLETVDFSDSMKEMQRNWIGKSEGAEIEFNIKNSDSKLNVYTTRPDTIFGVDFMVIAPEHEIVLNITTANQKAEVEKYLAYVKSRSERERLAEAKIITGCFTGAYAINPFDGKEIPIWIAEYVLAGYGTGTIMAVPCGDQRDFAFANHFKIPITNIIGSHFNGQEANATKDAVLQNSDFLNGMIMKDAMAVAINKVEELGIGKRKVNYRMRDAGFSRQRYWGEPFPITWSDGIANPIDASELPLELPHVDKYSPGPNGEGPLANLTDWVDLSPNPSPNERGTKAPGYYNSTIAEWKKTIGFAKQNRKEPTIEENIIWQKLRNRKIGGFKFRRQHPIAGYIPDFVCLEKKLIVEIDGGYHNKEEQKIYDAGREAWLAECGFTMIRFTNDEVKNSVKNVLKSIEQALLNKKVLEKEELKTETNINSELEKQPALENEGLAPSPQESESSKYESLKSEGLTPSPLERAGGEVRRETSTMPGYAGSSWYFLRYMDPHNDKTFCDRKASDYWNQVDLYIGGTEHAVGHLLYSRMWTKVLFDLGLIGFDEPYKKLLNQGMIQGSSRFVYRLNVEIPFTESKLNFDEKLLWKKLPFLSKFHYDNFHLPETKKLIQAEYDEIFKNTSLSEFKISQPSPLHVDVNIVDGVELDIEEFKKWRNGEYANAEFILEDGKYICGVETEKMSKSKFNTVNPDELCDKYGADTFRMYEMFLGPVEASKPWDTKGIEGVHRFLRKLWRLLFDEVKGKIWTDEKATDTELKVLHRTIKKIEEDTERFSFNTAVSTFMICVNELADLKCSKKVVIEQLLILLAPYAPHISEELWHQLGNKGSVLDANYPTFNPALLVESTKDYPVSVNGKLRTNIELSLNLEQKQVEEMILENDIVKKWLDGKLPKKIIFVKNKMINVVV